MKKQKGTRGAISVFLAIILVPCIVVSSVFVDLSRVHLSKTTAESSADLALNALLTNYDADLKDWYGMVASCQNIDEFYEVSANYFLRMLKSQGMSDEEIVLLSDYYSNATGDDTIYDLLQTESISTKVVPVQGANLSNASLMKDQVVEFMKYRAPIEIASEIIDRWGSDSSVAAALEADENEPLVKDKQEFYESEGQLTEAAYESYKAIRKYYSGATSSNLTNESLSADYSGLQNYKNAYKEILAYVVSNLSNTGGMDRYSRYTITLTNYNDYYSNPSKNFSEVYSEKKTIEDVEHYYIDLADVETLVTKLQEKIEAFNTAKTEFETAAQPVLNKLPYGTEANQIHPIQWWVQMNKAINAGAPSKTTALATAAQEMLRAYSRVLAIDKCELRGTVPAEWDSLADWKEMYGATDMCTTVESLQGKYLTSGINDDNDTYLKAVKALESVSAAQYGNTRAANLYITVDGQRLNLEGALSHISAELTAVKEEMNGHIARLTTAIDGDTEKGIPSLDSLKTYVKTYETKLNDWSGTANNSTTGMGEVDREEIATREAAVEIEEADVGVLKTRLVNIRSQLKDMVSAIDSLKWGGEPIINITTIDVFKSKAGVDSSAMGSTNSQLSGYTNTLFGQKFAPQTMPTMKNADNTAYNVTIHPETGNPATSGKVDTPKLWIYLYDCYGGIEEKMDEAKKEKEAAKKAGDEAAKAAKDKNRYNGGGKNVPWAFSGSEKFNLGSSVAGLIGVVEDLITLNFTGMRDDLFVTTYMMEMFSYATYENEGLYHLLEETDAEKITQLNTKNYKTYYAAVNGANAENKDGTWLSEKPQDSYNKSLTNHLINKGNNPAYCAEIEYILCGGKDSKNADNVKAVYNKIYGIRYGLNLVSSFQHFWNPANLKTDLTAKLLYTAAAALQSATMGMIPIPVTEAVLLPILTIFETAKDLDRLELGFPVELYKTEPEQWWISLSYKDQSSAEAKKASAARPNGIEDFMNLFTGGLEKNNTGEGLFYSDYLMLFVYLGLKSGAEGAMYQRMAEVIQFNMGTVIKTATGAESVSYSLQKSQVYFKMDSQLRVKPLMITMPIFNDYENNLDTNTDWCTYKINTVRGYS